MGLEVKLNCGFSLIKESKKINHFSIHQKIMMGELIKCHNMVNIFHDESSLSMFGRQC